MHARDPGFLASWHGSSQGGRARRRLLVLGLAMAFGGVLRDAVASWSDSATGYPTVYSLEVLLLGVTLVARLPMLGKRLARTS